MAVSDRNRHPQRRYRAADGPGPRTSTSPVRPTGITRGVHGGLQPACGPVRAWTPKRPAPGGGGRPGPVAHPRAPCPGTAKSPCSCGRTGSPSAPSPTRGENRFPAVCARPPSWAPPPSYQMEALGQRCGWTARARRAAPARGFGHPVLSIAARPALFARMMALMRRLCTGWNLVRGPGPVHACFSSWSIPCSPSSRPPAGRGGRAAASP
jgi:hypothetical protein